MNKDFTDDTFLARWLDGKLSDVELEAFEKRGDFHSYKKIVDTANMLKAPAFDTEKAFKALLKSRGAIIRKPAYSIWSYAVAASVAIIMGIFFLFPSEIKFNSQLGEQLAFNLPDGSSVKLNAKSELSFVKKTWKEKRDLNLNGEAYFKVNKGSKFTVHTNKGNVSVLGTEFNVFARDNYFEVQCFEGRVKVDYMGSAVILKAGDAIRYINDNEELWTFTQQSPAWVKGESTFKNLPLKEVVLALERHYKIHFEAKGVDLSQRFTGSFTHDNLKLALKSVFYPMDIKYKIKDKNQVLLFRK